MSLSFIHNGDCGDVVYSLPALLGILSEWGVKPSPRGTLYLRPSSGGGYFGGQHFYPERIDWLLPLLAHQPYLEHVEEWNGELVNIDLNMFRKLPVDFRMNSLIRLYFWTFPVFWDFSNPWLFLTQIIPSDYIVVNRTKRYRNWAIDYTKLEGYKVGFVGLDDEYEDFKKEVPSAVRLVVNDALELAQLLAGCRFFVGNQSVAFAIAEGLKVRRLLEVSSSCPNVVVSGPNGFDAINKFGFDSAINKLLS